MATTFKVLGNGTPVLSMRKWVKEKHIDEDDYFEEWQEFHVKHPSVSKWEYDLKQKELQEV